MLANFRDALASYKLNWTVSTKPVYTHSPDTGFVVVPGANAVVRTDTNRSFSVVGDRYEVCQNDAVADIFDGVLAGIGGGEYVKGGTFGGGKKVYLQAKLPGTITVKGSDHSDKMLTYVNSHDMSTNILCGFTAVRIVCQNTYAMAAKDLSQQIAIRHTRSSAYKLQTVQSILQSQLEYFKYIEEQANWLASNKFTHIQLDKALKTAFSVGDVEELSGRTQGVFDQIVANFENGAGIDASNRGTAWAAYNAFTEYSNHQKSVRNSEERGGESVARFESVLLGSGAQLNNKALSAITMQLAA